ncbi:MAG TPA: hypothetical protein VF545_11385 [Thermoleophilaceae bacterium]|jgi:hypothetical protein
MAVPRSALLGILGLALIASVFLVTRSGSSESVSSPKTAVKAQQARPAPARKPADRHAKPSDRHAKPATARHASTPAKKAAPAPAEPAPAARPPKGAAATPASVLAAAQALARNDAVVFFFSKPGAADDTLARGAVHKLRGMRRVSIFDVTLDQVAAYRPMLSGLGISQIPSTVIVRPGKKAVLIQGFVDAGTLRQNVADALR